MLHLSRKVITHAVESFQLQQDDRLSEVFTFDEINRFRPAAVIIPLLKHDGLWHVLLTHRSQTLVEHRGQIAYPGGAWERQDENLQATALREMNEEIGIDPADVYLFGELGDMPILTGYKVRLFVGQIPWPYELEINTAEVESVFIVPFHWLVNPHHRTEKVRSYAGREFPVVFFDHFQGHQLWGASAEMTIAFFSALGLIE